MEHQDLKVSKDLLVSQVSLVLLDLQELWDLLDPLDVKEKMVRTVNPDSLVLWVHLDLRVSEVSPETQELLEQRGIEVCLVFLAKREKLVFPDQMENPVILANPVLQVFKDQEDLLVTVVDLDLLDHQVHEVLMEPQDNLDHLVQLVTPDHQDSLELQDRKENLDLLDLEDLRDLKENVVSLVHLDHQDLLA